MHAPAFFHQGPVGFVAVHGDVLAPAARGDARVEAAAVEAGEEGLEGFDVVERAGFRHVAAIEQNVDAHRAHALLLRPRHQRLEVVDVAVHVAVGEQAEQVDHAAAGAFAVFRRGDDLAPGLPGPDRAGGNGIGHQRGPLRINLAGADRVVADLGIAHVLVGRHAYRGAVGAQAHVGISGEQAVEHGLARRGDGAAELVLRQAVAVHDDRDDRAGDAGESWMPGQHLAPR